ncbi:type VII secretion protein EccCa [Kitasatospora sp. NPDC052896]|uniref:type VII secretion protein EccCa n=1 Tax=Kitasatospora sp. NPDC052896 TaxID=3364061 RepID=UPI0037C5607F
MSVVTVKRLPRLSPPGVPGEPVVLVAPPELPPERDGGGGWTELLPLLGMGSSAAFLFLPGATGFMKVMGGLMAASTVAMALAQLVHARRGDSGDLTRDRRDHLRHLGQARRGLRRTARLQRAAALFTHPDPGQLWALAADGRRVWERRPGDPDFGQVRIGTGTQRLATPITLPPTAPLDRLEPLTAQAVQRLVATHGTLDAMPMTVALRGFRHLALAGDPETVHGVTRSLLAQLTTLHSPEDLVLAVACGPGSAAAWEWTKWLPHAQDVGSADGAGSGRLVRGGLDELETLLADRLSGRPRFDPGGPPVLDRPHLVVLLDGGRVPGDSPLVGGEGLQGVTVIELLRGGARGDLRLTATPERLSVELPDGTTYRGGPDRISGVQAEALARLLAPLRPAGPGGDEPPLSGLDFTDLLERPRAAQERLRVPIGVGEGGEPVLLDLKEAAQEGMGPHGLCVGATGSGKSELLRTLVLGLAATHSPETLNFVLADFKGGATFAELAELPHVAALITNLAEDLALVERMAEAVSGELTRRQELLRAAGNFANLTDYERARTTGAALAALPTLLLVIDEFSELLTARPEFIDVFIQIGRIGRSLGVHLLLASQRLEESRLRGLEAYLSYRIGLRTFSAAESRTAIGVPDAYHLPPVPGVGYLRTGTDGLVRFTAGYVSGPHRPGGSGAPVGGGRRPALFTAAPVPLPAVEPPVLGVDGETVLEAVVRRLAGQGPPAHRVWLPPLERSPSLDGLLPPLVATPERGLTAPGHPALGRLTVPVGLVDRPAQQRRDVWSLDFSGAAGHALVVGGPRSGKSTLLRTVIASFGLTHTPTETQFYCLDFGGGGLLALDDLPHVGQVATRLDPERVRRTVAEVHGVLNAREELFRAERIDSVETYRRHRAAGRFPELPWGDVFLVIDGWAAFRGENEPLEPVVQDIAARGLNFGVHLVITAARPGELRPGLRDQLLGRVELRLSDPMDSEVDRRRAGTVPIGRPGRGLTPDRLHWLAGLPRLDGSAVVEDLADGTAALVTAVRDAWPGAPAPRVRLLPELLDADRLPGGGEQPRSGVAFGIDEDALAPVFVDFETDPLFLVYGGAESGKSALLRLLTHQIAERYPPERALLVVADYRRAHLGRLPERHLHQYCTAQPQLREVLTSLAGSMGRRLPGPDVTPEQLDERSWYHQPDAFVVVDDYDLVAVAGGNPLQPLLEYLPFARDLGLRVIVARNSAGAGRASFEPVTTRMRELGAQGVLLSGDAAEGPLLGGVRPRALPPGRGVFVGRRGAPRVVQTGWHAIR